MYVYRGEKVNLKISEFILPNKVKVKKEVVEHRGASLIIPVLEDGRLVMVEQFRPILGVWLLEFPAGTIEKGEDALSCAKRELVEEAGYVAQEIEELFKSYPSPGYSDEILHIFVAKKLSEVQSHPENYELIKVRKLKVNEILNILSREKTLDMKTVAALFYYLNCDKCLKENVDPK
ncbi:MAG: NUDIX hydrolase [Thermoproteota archaeon]|nr:NUDIX hydrolase [Candidatus Brockarchaeota archaeon]